MVSINPLMIKKMNCQSMIFSCGSRSFDHWRHELRLSLSFVKSAAVSLYVGKTLSCFDIVRFCESRQYSC